MPCDLVSVSVSSMVLDNSTLFDLLTRRPEWANNLIYDLVKFGVVPEHCQLDRDLSADDLRSYNWLVNSDSRFSRSECIVLDFRGASLRIYNDKIEFGMERVRGSQTKEWTEEMKQAVLNGIGSFLATFVGKDLYETLVEAQEEIEGLEVITQPEYDAQGVMYYDIHLSLG